MILKLRRPIGVADRPRYAVGGPVVQGSPGVPSRPAAQVDTGPNPDQQRATQALRNAGVAFPTASQVAQVAQAAAQDRSSPSMTSKIGPAVARALQIGGSNGVVPQPGSGHPDHVQAALAPRSEFARGGAIAPGLPSAPFASMPTPAVATPGLASPHGLLGAHHRTHFADGGLSLPSHVVAALGLRPHFDDGGSAWDQSGSAIGFPADPVTTLPASSSATLASRYDPMTDPAVQKSLGLADGVAAIPDRVRAALALRPHLDDGGDAGGGGDHGGSGDGGAGDGGAGGSGDGGDGSGAGAGNGNSAGSGAGNGDGTGTGTGTGTGSSGGQSDASTGGADTSSAGSVGSTSTGQSDAATGAANGSDSGIGGAVGSAPAAANPASGVEGAAGLGAAAGYGSATSGPVGSIAGSVGAPAAGGFSSPGAPATGGFGSFSAGPTATSNLGGLSGGTPTASSMSGQTAGQSMASEAASSGDPGEDGTGLGGLGSSPTTAQAFGSFGPAPSSAYGTTASAEQAFGGVTASDLGNVSGLSPTGQQLGALGLGAMPAGMTQSPTGFSNIGAYGLSSVTNGITPGFDNLGAVNGVDSVQRSSLGPDGYQGAEADSPTDLSSTLQGFMPGSLVNGMYASLPDAEQPAQTSNDLTPGFSPNYSGFTLGADGQPSFAGNLGVVGDAVTGLRGLGTLANGVAGGVPSSSPVSTNATSATPGVNADGDPTSVDGISALTVHGPVTEAATGGYDAPGPVSTYGGITDQQAFNARQAAIAAGGIATPAQAATISGYVSQQNSPVGPTVGLGAAPTAAAGAVAAPVGLGVADAAPSAPTDQTTASAPSPVSTVPGLPVGDVFNALHAIEGGVLDGKVDPNNPNHYGPGQFSQATFSDAIANHPELGFNPGMSMFSATPDQYAAVVQAHWGDIQTALKNAGIPATPGNTYAGWNLGITGGIRALSAGPNASLAEAGISPAVQAANPSIYGGVQTVGQLQSKLAGMFAGASTTSTASSPSTVAAAAGLGVGVAGAPATFSPSGYSTTDSGFDATTDTPIASPLTITAAPAAPVSRTVTSPGPYGVSSDTETALGNYGMEATPANALAADTLGFGVASQVMNGNPSDPVSAADISPAAIRANPSLFSGVQTLGDLRANITNAAQTAGTTTSTVADPGTPATSATPSSLPASVQAALSPAWGSPGSYAGVDGENPPGFSLGMMAAGIPATVNTAGTLGLPSGVGLTQAEQNLAGWSQVPSSTPTLARAAIAAPGFAPSPGFTSTPTAASTPDTSTSPGTPDTSAPSTPAPSNLSVPTGITNTAANIGLGIVGGPVGGIVAGINGLSGLLGGPTIAGGINGMLANAGTPSAAGSQSGGSSQGNILATLASPSGSDDGSASSSNAPASGTNSLDPHADAMAAYQAAIAGDGPQSTSNSPQENWGYQRALTIRGAGNGAPVSTPAPLYNPMQDPSVLHALGLA